MKTVFYITFDHCIDVITNSSSELFIMQAESKSILDEMLRNVCPNYTNEWTELKHVSELDNYDLVEYLERKNYMDRQSKFFEDVNYDLIFKEDAYYSEELSEFGLDYVRGKLTFSNDYILESRIDNPDYDTVLKFEDFGQRYHI